MARVKNKNTSPELVVRKALHRLGYRFRLHRRDLPGIPDIVLPRHHAVILVHGCFWHSHDCPRGKRPASRQEFWNEKLDRNMARDKENIRLLEEHGWRVLILWECRIKDKADLEKQIKEFLGLDRIY